MKIYRVKTIILWEGDRKGQKKGTMKSLLEINLFDDLIYLEIKIYVRIITGK